MNVNPGVFQMLTLDMYQKNPKYFDLLLDNLTDDIFVKLPKKVQNLPGIADLVSKKAITYKNDGYDNTGYDINWKDKDGNLREYIKLFGNFPIKSKDDYLNIVEMFLSSDMSIPQFCSYYKIDDVKGFERLLNKLKSESKSQKDTIQTHNNNLKNKYWADILKNVNDIKMNTFSFDTYFKERYSSNHNFTDFLNRLNANDKVKLVNEFIDYVDKNEFALPIFKIMTLFNVDNQNMVSGILCQLSKYNNNIPKESLSRIKSILNAYSIPYSRRNHIGNIYRLKDGSEYTVTDDSIDQALAYMDDHDILRCAKTASYYIRQTTLGILKYEAKTEDSKDELKQILSELVKERLEIKDYFETIDKHSRTKK